MEHVHAIYWVSSMQVAGPMDGEWRWIGDFGAFGSGLGNIREMMEAFVGASQDCGEMSGRVKRVGRWGRPSL